MRNLKFILGIIFFSGMTFFAQAQEIDYPLADEEAGLMRYMAQMAWSNNPINDNFSQEVVIAKEKVKIAKRGWWRNVSLSFNLNEANLQPDSIFNRNTGINEATASAGNVFFPKYNFGAVFDLGSIFDTPNKKKIAQRKVKIAESLSQQAEKDVKGQIIQLYQEYLTAIEILKLRYKSEADMKTSYQLVDQLFSQGDKRVGLADVNDASLALNNVQESRIKANRNVVIAKLKLEDFIGVKLETVEAKFKKKR